MTSTQRHYNRTEFSPENAATQATTVWTKIKKSLEAPQSADESIETVRHERVLVSSNAKG